MKTDYCVQKGIGVDTIFFSSNTSTTERIDSNKSSNLSLASCSSSKSSLIPVGCKIWIRIGRQALGVITVVEDWMFVACCMTKNNNDNMVLMSVCVLVLYCTCMCYVHPGYYLFLAPPSWIFWLSCQSAKLGPRWRSLALSSKSVNLSQLKTSTSGII